MPILRTAEAHHVRLVGWTFLSVRGVGFFSGNEVDGQECPSYGQLKPILRTAEAHHVRLVGWTFLSVRGDEFLSQATRWTGRNAHPTDS